MYDNASQNQDHQAMFRSSKHTRDPSLPAYQDEPLPA